VRGVFDQPLAIRLLEATNPAEAPFGRTCNRIRVHRHDRFAALFRSALREERACLGKVQSGMVKPQTDRAFRENANSPPTRYGRTTG